MGTNHNDKARDILEDGKNLLPKSNEPAPLSVESLLAMLVESQNRQAEAYQQLSEALLESRKPYVDPKVLEAKKQELKQRQEMIAIEQRRRDTNKKYCPHKRENGTWNIKWMQHSNGIVLGVCGTCNSPFDSRVPADAAILRQDLKSLKNMGRAGEHARRTEIALA